MTEHDRQEWNAAVAAGDGERIAELQDRHLLDISRRIMNDDPNYATAGWATGR